MFPVKVCAVRVSMFGAFVLAVWAAGPASVHANILSNPGYEVNALVPGVGVLTNIPGNANTWGAENGNIVGATGGVSPAGGVQMLQMLDDGLSYTQGWQAVNVQSLAAQIDAGQAGFAASALFNVDSAVAAALAGLGVHFIDGTGVWGNFTGAYSGTSQTLDANPSTWQSISKSGSVPVGTRWLIIEVNYNNASLLGTQGVVEAGYVDDAALTVRAVPTPAAALVGVALMVGAVVRRRRCAN